MTSTAIDAPWYALVFVVVALRCSQLDPLLLVPIAIWLILYGVLFRLHAWSRNIPSGRGSGQ